MTFCEIPPQKYHFQINIFTNIILKNVFLHPNHQVVASIDYAYNHLIYSNKAFWVFENQFFKILVALAHDMLGCAQDFLKVGKPFESFALFLVA